MHDRSLHADGPPEGGTTSIGGTEANRGIGFPRFYDLLLRIMTRGRDSRFRADLLDRAGIAPGHHVLDVGCGTGTQAIAAHARVQPGGSVVGIDVSPNMLAAARRKVRRADVEIELRQADAAALPFDNERFDVVTFTTVMHMVPENRRRLSLREASRVLRRGGRLLLVDYAGSVRKRSGLIAKHGAHGRFDLHDLCDALSEEGFDEIEGGPLAWLSLHFLRGTKK
jgi:SAM-dependent methyltransferase